MPALRMVFNENFRFHAFYHILCFAVPQSLSTRAAQIYFGKMPQIPRENLTQKVNATPISNEFQRRLTNPFTQTLECN